jgi:hypothetical protein
MADSDSPGSPSCSPRVIPLTDCVDRGVYYLVSRNLIAGVFRKETGGFIGIREKCGYRYLFEEYHRDKGPPFGTVAPLEKLGELPERIPLRTHKEHTNGGLWLKDRHGKLRPVRDQKLEPGEKQHGCRQGFVQVWTDTNRRIPAEVWPHLVTNHALYRFLIPFERIAAKKRADEMQARKMELVRGALE